MLERTGAGGRHRRAIAPQAPSLRVGAVRSLGPRFLDDVRNALVACVGGMMLIATIPVILGWHTTVVVSGSMTPGIKPGDVIAAAPVRGADRSGIASGTIVLVKNPARSGELLMHRLVRYDAEGRLILKGDANASADSTPVPLDQVQGVARLRVPLVGLPLLWVRQGRFQPVVATAILLFALVAWQARQRRTAPAP
jgi:signal peptidase